MGYFYGYGINLTANQVRPASTKRLLELLKKAPGYMNECMEALEGEYTVNLEELSAGTMLDILTRNHSSCCSSLAPVLAEVIWEAEGIELSVDQDMYGQEFLYLAPTMPWNCASWARDLTREKLDQVYRDYLDIVTDATVCIDFHDIA